MHIHPHAAECPRRQDAPGGRAEQARHPFTPGPWLYAHRETTVSGGMYSTEVFTDDGGSGKGVIATCSWYPMPPDERGAIGTYREANARLIAAAPELLETLSNLMLHHMLYHNVPGPVDAPLKPLLDAGFAAIRKARGEQ